MPSLASNPILPAFNPYSAEFIGDPYRHYDQLREVAPVCFTDLGFWFVTRHDDVSKILRDPCFGRNFAVDMESLYGPRAFDEPILAAMNRMMLFLDPPDHPRIRGLVAKAFSHASIEDLRQHIQETADRLVAANFENGEMDLVRDFAFELPIRVISALLGIPEEDRIEFFQNFQLSGRVLDAGRMSREELDQANKQMAYLHGYFVRLFDRKRRSPADDLSTYLVRVEEGGDRLSTDELVATVILLFAAGFETTSNLIGNAILALFEHPRELEKLKRDPGRTAGAVDELIRYNAPVQFTGRTVREETEIRGQVLRKGDFVAASLAAANRDPAVYDRPGELNVDRQNVRPLSFGGGIHFCLGAQLARVELETTLRTLFGKLPNLAPKSQDSPQWKPSFVWRGLQNYVLQWDPSSGGHRNPGAAVPLR
jgi:cytochrome P450